MLRSAGSWCSYPYPIKLTLRLVLDTVDPNKDVDAFHPHNVGLISQGRHRFLPCTPHGIVQMLKRYKIETTGKNVCVIGRSDIVGKPMAMMLSGYGIGLGSEFANATVTLCHSRTSDLAATVAQADIVIAAIGRPKFVTAAMLKPGAVVVDVGINRTDDGLVGDVDFDKAMEVASYVTPVPGGVGTTHSNHVAGKHAGRRHATTCWLIDLAPSNIWRFGLIRVNCNLSLSLDAIVAFRSAKEPLLSRSERRLSATRFICPQNNNNNARTLRN